MKHKITPASRTMMRKEEVKRGIPVERANNCYPDISAVHLISLIYTDFNTFSTFHAQKSRLYARFIHKLIHRQWINAHFNTLRRSSMPAYALGNF